MSNKKRYYDYNEETNRVIDVTNEVVDEVVEEAIDEVVAEEAIDEVVDEVVEEVIDEVVDEVVETLVGIVNCAKLNVREKADIKSTSVYVVNKDDVLLIDTDKSTDEWYKIYTETGIEGFCMKKFVSVNN